VALRKAGKPACWFAAIGACGALAAAASALPAAATSPTVTIQKTSFSGTWHEGWFGVWQTRVVHHLGRSDLVWKRVGNGSLHVSGTLSTAARVAITLRAPSGKVIVTSGTRSLPAGAYRMALGIQRPLPGPYSLTAAILDGRGLTIFKVDQPLTFPTPPEGVVARASVSATENGPSVTVLRGRHEAWAHFRFLTLPPNTRTVYIQWRQPDWVHVCQQSKGPVPNCRLKKQIAADGSVDTFLRSPSAPLQQGRWYCQLSVGSKVARRTFVTIR